MTGSTYSAAYFQRNRVRIYQRRKEARVRARDQAERMKAAQWLIRAVLDEIEPPQRINYFRPMPVRRPLLTLKRTFSTRGDR